MFAMIFPLVICKWKSFLNKDCLIYLGKAKLALKDYEGALFDFKKYKVLDSTDEIQKLIETCEENLRPN